jgi:lipoprotein-anchoring transpeptidase ErfK/SrfK
MKPIAAPLLLMAAGLLLFAEVASARSDQMAKTSAAALIAKKASSSSAGSNSGTQLAEFFGQPRPTSFPLFWRQPMPYGQREQADRPTTRSAFHKAHRHVRYNQRIAALVREPYSAPPTKGPLLLSISLAKQALTIYDSGVPIATSPISSGVAKHPTPMGVFTVLERQVWHESNIYSRAPMPLMQRLTWSGIALHAGVLPGYPASHGCIRLPESFALKLWHTTRIGARVVISWDEAVPRRINHHLLFQPQQPGDPPADPQTSRSAVNILADADTGHERTMARVAGIEIEADQHKPSGSKDESKQPVLQILASRRHREPEASYSEVYGRTSGALVVFVSRPESRIYVRQGFRPAFDSPITIVNPNLPLGTHVFTAVASVASGTKLDWTVISPEGRYPIRSTSSGPAEALDRITLPSQAVERIRYLVGVGATLIVSDAGLDAAPLVRDADFTVLLH